MDGADCLGLAVKSEKTYKSIQPISLVEAIRKRPWMYLRHPKEPLKEILETLVENFQSLEISEYSICEKSNVYVIKSKQDWIRHNGNKDIEYYFNEEQNIKGRINAGLFLTAFHFSFYTIGDAGEYGNQKMINTYFSKITNEGFEQYGRVFLIAKEQKLPEDHGINFERPEWLNTSNQ